MDQRTNDIVHDLRSERRSECGRSLEETGEYIEHTVEDIPPPQVEVHRYRRHRQRCACCRKVTPPAAPPEVADATIGPRTRLLMGYSRSHLGLSLGKSVALLDEVFGLKLSRAGALGHAMWAGELVDPVVRRLFELLKPEPVIHADETGWRINGKNVCVWCFCNPRLALFLVDEHRSGAVVQRVLGDSLPGVLVTDFYAAYHAIDCVTLSREMTDGLGTHLVEHSSQRGCVADVHLKERYAVGHIPPQTGGEVVDHKRRVSRCQIGLHGVAADEIRDLVLKLARENEWGYTRILGVLRKLGINSISRQTMKRILKENEHRSRSETRYTHFVAVPREYFFAVNF